jgi:hypothetical protein
MKQMVDSRRPGVESRRRCSRLITRLLATVLGLASALADDFGSPALDRAAVERVYYNHRLGQKPPFEQSLPPSTLAQLVRLDLTKEAVLRKAYGVTVTPAMLDTEVQRINNATRAPDMLAEIKAALSNDPLKFANVFAKPILVERLLRDKFENDDVLHTAARRACETARYELIAAKSNGASPTQLLTHLKQAHSNAVSEATWQLSPRPAETRASSADEIEIKRRFGQQARVISSPAAEKAGERRFYFEDLPEELQKHLRKQLHAPGDVSAVIETPGGFLLYFAKKRSEKTIAVGCLFLPKRSYEQWLHEQERKL